MNAGKILSEFARRGITLRVVDGKLHARPLSAVPPELAEAAREHRAAIVAALATPHEAHRAIIHAKVAAIEAEALACGWPRELLWNEDFWKMPRGLISVLENDDEIGAVTGDCIEILRHRRDLLRFRRAAA